MEANGPVRLLMREAGWEVIVGPAERMRKAKPREYAAWLGVGRERGKNRGCPHLDVIHLQLVEPPFLLGILLILC